MASSKRPSSSSIAAARQKASSLRPAVACACLRADATGRMSCASAAAPGALQRSRPRSYAITSSCPVPRNAASLASRKASTAGSPPVSPACCTSRRIAGRARPWAGKRRAASSSIRHPAATSPWAISIEARSNERPARCAGRTGESAAMTPGRWRGPRPSARRARRRAPRGSGPRRDPSPAAPASRRRPRPSPPRPSARNGRRARRPRTPRSRRPRPARARTRPRRRAPRSGGRRQPRFARGLTAASASTSCSASATGARGRPRDIARRA